MITIYNIRGTNGSGKSTLARAFIPEGAKLKAKLCRFPSPTKKDPEREGTVVGYPRLDAELDLSTIVVGPYETPTGGMDNLPNFETSFKAIRAAVATLEMHSSCEHRAVIAEGVLASTVWGSWGEFAGELDDIGVARMAFCYLDTPLEVCFERIRQRQKAAGKERPIKEQLVADKFTAIAATRRKAIEAGHLVYDLPHQYPVPILQGIMTNHCEPMGKPYRETYVARL